MIKRKSWVVFFILGCLLVSSFKLFSAETANLQIMTSLEQEGKVYLSWLPVEGEVTYQILRDGTVIGKSKIPFYTDTELKVGKKYNYTVTCIKDGKEDKTFTSSISIVKLKKPLAKRKVEIKDGQIFVDKQRLIVCGVGYAPYRPGTTPSHPYPRNYNLIEKDFELMKKAGFNTIRNWSANDMDEYMMELAAKYDLMVIQGIWISPSIDYKQSTSLEESIDAIKYEVNRWKDHANILCYILMNEPNPENIAQAGLAKANDFFRQVVKIAKETDSRPISMAYWPRADFIASDMWDIITTTYYPYDKSHIRIFSYRGYLSWLKRTKAYNKPLIIVEDGYSVSKKGAGELGYGGNTEEQQAQGLVKDFYDVLSAGADGLCVFEWLDEWWKEANDTNDENVHNDEPEEWYGIIGITDISKPEGSPRLAYQELDKVFNAFIVYPQDSSKIQGQMAIWAYSDTETTGKVKNMECSFDNKKWIKLYNQKNWWRIDFDTRKITDGEYNLQIRYNDKQGNTVYLKQPLKIIVANNEVIGTNKIEIIPAKRICRPGEQLSVDVKITENDKPKTGAKLKYCFVATGAYGKVVHLTEEKEATTNDKGVLNITQTIEDNDNKPYFLMIAVGTDSLLPGGQTYAERAVVMVVPK